MTKKFIFILIFSLVFQNIYAQNTRVKFEKLSVENGLSQSTVMDMIQDSKGFIWFATLDGLNKYDGYDINVYWNSPNKENAITDNIVNCLYETPNENNEVLWIGTAANGICQYDRSKDYFISYRHNPKNKNSLSNDIITAIEGNNSELWIGTYKGLNLFNPTTKKFEHFIYNEEDLNSISSDTITVIVNDKKGNLLIGTLNGFNIFNKKTKKFKRYFTTNGLCNNEITSIAINNKNEIFIGTTNGISILNQNTDEIITISDQITDKIDINHLSVTSILLDLDSSIWIGTNRDGLIRYNLITDKVDLFINNPALKNSISINSITNIYLDKSDILWIGTSLGGVNKWNRAADDLTVFRHNPYDENSLSASQVRCIYTGKNDIVWIGTVEGGLNKWNTELNKFEHYKHNEANPNSISHNHVRTILEDKNNNFWIGTDGGGLNKFNKETKTFKSFQHSQKDPLSISNNRVWKIIEDSKDRLWVATFGGGLNMFDKQAEVFYALKYDAKDSTSISSDLVTTIFEDNEGTLWIGTFNGLNKLYPDGNQFLRYNYEPENLNSISNDRIYSIYQDKKGYLWIGTKGGLNKLDIKTGEITRFTTDNSELPNNVILGILEDDGNIWVSTNNGISRINLETNRIKNFDIGDGLQSNEFLAGACFKDKNGQLFFGGIDGFNAFYPKNIIDNPHIPSIVITDFKVSNQDFILDSLVSVKKIIYLHHSQNDISFKFVALDFIFPEKNKYKYKLIGYDEKWNNNNFRRHAKYTNLPPGKYTFTVQGSNNDEVWNEKGRSITIIIKPAFWQTAWFQVSSVLFIIALTYLLYMLRVRQIKQRNKELEETVAERTSEIRQQNEEIKAQRDEIIVQKDQVEKHRQEITASIKYARRIQTAALPNNNYLTSIIPEHFVLFKPRDIVSGDFYWAGRKENKIIITAADCTGHGVPGAFMSMLGISFLNKIVNEDNILESNEILNKLRDEIINALHQEGSVSETKDGMDMTLCVIDTEKKTLNFSGAFNPLFIVHNNEIKEFKTDRMPVAIYDNMEPFNVHNVELSKGDTIYMSSDGYADQFSSETGKKFMKKRFRKLLLKISPETMEIQKELLEENYQAWRGTERQLDDIVVIGVKI